MAKISWTSGQLSVLLYIVIILVQCISQISAQHHPSQQFQGARRERPRVAYPRPHRPLQHVHPCEHSSCYPATGNLLIGRENRLYASSTCGLAEPERYCIVSHLKEFKCFLCDTRPETENDPKKNHRIGQIIYKNQPGTLEQSWWQSENGKENVTIQLDLEAEFHFTHLIIVFATFRPAAMLIERSYDFGKSWHVYRYFAHNCPESFPHVKEFSKNITDVICDSRYSGVEPSKNGELIYRVLPPNMNIENPYADHIQNMLKMTNLRINFTRLHTLGDTHLDDRQEIQEKYYYAISNMVVRGSCSCYGHASRCLPLDGVVNKYDMVHGRCECTHNTKGLNCEECEDFYNDLPWNPALGKQTNACKKCNCNNHASSCHFDQAVYEHSGKISGGVCDNCQHHTQGQHCEECVPFYYRDPNEDIQSPYVCKPCDCDPHGSVDDGICDSVTDPEYNIEAGACHCKVNVKGRRCDSCKDGFWNLNPDNPMGCENCTCNTLGTINNSGCNMYTGECTCKRLVIGKDCNECMPETYGLSDSHDGCSPCNCDSGGALDNNCDVSTGQCRCRPNMTGRMCHIPLQNHFIPSLQKIYEAEEAICTGFSSYGNCSIVVQEWPEYHRPKVTGPGYVRVPERTELVFVVDDIPRTMSYNVLIRYSTQTPGDWEIGTITVLRPDEYDPDGSCPQAHPSYETRRPIVLPEHQSSVVGLEDVCLERGKVYKFKIHFERHNHAEDNAAAQIFIDSIVLVPQIDVTSLFNFTAPPYENRQRENEQYRCNETFYDGNYDGNLQQECEDLSRSISTIVHDGATPCNCNPTGSLSKNCNDFGGNCQCKTNVVGRQCDRCAPGTYGFSPEGCKACDCNSIGSRDNECDLITGQCNCVANAYGRECDQCLPGFWNFPNCQMCECNGHAHTCNSKTGECTNCQDFTTGYRCDSCIDGFYGNPLLGSEIGCRPCRCPGTQSSGEYHAHGCTLDPRTNDMICHCKQGYTGAKCDVCADNYYGNEETGGECLPCDCSNNIDPAVPGNCDPHTGHCLNCLHNTAGTKCEYCKDGFHGNALLQQCTPCYCDLLGTDNVIQHCNRTTGQCPCLQNVEGLRCDKCTMNHWKIAKGEGCEPCGCDIHGSYRDQCNPYDGQCECRQGFGGRQCNQCETNYWGDPNKECFECKCDVYGSATQQCDRVTGQCQCIKGIGGYKCNECDRGYLGQAPYCSPCGECFDNWDLILSNLKNETLRVIDEAKNIKTVGATGAYTKEFDTMGKKLEKIRQLLENTTISGQDIEGLESEVQNLRKALNGALENIKRTENYLEDLDSNINLANVELLDLHNRTENIKNLAGDLKRNATQLQEANVDGALNLTRQAYERVLLVNQKEMETQELIENAARQCKRTEILVNRTSDEVRKLSGSNAEALVEYEGILEDLNGRLPDLNELMCGGRGEPCDDLCGGAGCGVCGGLSCEKGALTKAEKALNYAKDTEKTLREKDEQAEELIRSLSQAKTNASEAWRRANRVFNESELYYNETDDYINVARSYITNLTDVINSNTALPSEIEAIADETLKLALELDPEEIKNLATRIDETVSSLENVEDIIEQTRGDLATVENLKDRANHAKKRADEVLTEAKNVAKALEDADEAQEKASEAISKANEDISSARIDLDQIDGETGDAQKKAHETATTVNILTGKLTELGKKFLKNDLDANEIQRQSDNVKDLANNAHELVTQLKNDYKQANNSLSAKAVTSESARERAQQLLQRASRITVETTGKLKELRDMEDVYKVNGRELESLQQRIASLNDDMTKYLTKIQMDSDRYRQCTS
ncbi:laminin subunit beta-1 [Lutzomyia longipalpis]|uniref:laminin subunit beta-1 n=1 Tax=Lutzomyia longipalpis TaxID=7200 RepID=UPI002483C85C|nr:laminin subunit beta-1 [Lutzomyia longipalpis]XP_055695880.1 laminin subunit beta-1 [Lutzomyia longipalpis]